MAVAAARDLILNLRENRQGHAFLEVANDLERAAKGADKTGDAFARMRMDAQRLNAEIEVTKARVKDLDAQFARTGDRSLFGDIRKERAYLRQLQQMVKELSPDELPPLMFNTKALMPTAVGGLAALVAAWLPALGAMIEGVIVGTTAGGGIAGGIVAAAHSSQVKGAWQEFIESLDAEDFAKNSFIEPTVQGIGIISQAFDDLDLDEALAKGAPSVPILAEGIADLARNIMPGFNAVMDHSTEYSEAFAYGLGEVGDALGDALTTMVESEGTLAGIRGLFEGLAGTIRGLGEITAWLGDRFQDSAEMVAPMAGVFADVYDAVADHTRLIPILGPLERMLADTFGDVEDAARRVSGESGPLEKHFSALSEETIVANQGLDPFIVYLHKAERHMAQLRGETEATNLALQDYWQKLRGMDDANIAWEQAIDDLTKSVKENGTSLDIHTEKGRNNIRAVNDAIDAARRQFETGQITLEQYNAQIQALMAIGVNAGLSRKELEKLAGKYTIDLFVRVIAPAVAKGANNFVASALNAIFGGGSNGGVQVNMGRPMKEYAAGGETPAFEPFRVHDGEMLWSSKQHYVSTAAQTSALAASTSGGGTIRIIVQDTSGRELRNQLITDAQMRGVTEATISAAYP